MPSEMVTVSSSWIQAIGYEAGSLYVKTKKEVYAYPGYSEADYAAFLGASSKGGWFDNYIRPRFPS